MRTKLVAAAVALSAAAITAPANAATTAECQGLIDDLSAGTAAAPSLSAKDRARLVDKAEAAGEKLEIGKVADALTKLGDFDSQLDALHGAAKPKVSDADFVHLAAGVDAALTCVAGAGSA